MKKTRNIRKYALSITLIFIVIAVVALSLGRPVSDSGGSPSYTGAITDTISRIVSGCPGETGVCQQREYLPHDERIQGPSGTCRL